MTPRLKDWFQKKVLNKATSQVRDTLQFLDEHVKSASRMNGATLSISGAPISARSQRSWSSLVGEPCPKTVGRHATTFAVQQGSSTSYGS